MNQCRDQRLSQTLSARPLLPLFIALFGVFIGVPAMSLPAAARSADEMPPPKAAPRLPVSREKLFEDAVRTAPKTQNSATRTASGKNEMAGAAQALDGASLRLGKTELRLAGLIVAPVTEPAGMAARTTLDQLIEGQSLNCVRRDKERDGRVMVSCTRTDGSDLAAEMLRAGAALYSRTSMLPDDVATTYRVAEGQAQHAKRGLWTNVPTNKAAQNQNVATPAEQSAQPPAQPIVTADAAPVKVTPTIQAVAQTMAVPVAAAATAIPAPTTSISSALPTKASPMNDVVTEAVSPFTTFMMTAGLIGLMTFALAFFDYLQRRRVRYTAALEMHQQRQIIAAALAGEMAAARDVCESRLHAMASGGEARWPRLRSFVYQTHVDKIGLLGPFLARQVAAIYGQMADATGGREELPFRNSEPLNRTTVTKTLDRLCEQMDAALEGLSFVEMSGDVFLPNYSENYVEETPRQVTNAPTAKSRPPLKSIIARNRSLPKPERHSGYADTSDTYKNNYAPPRARETVSRPAAKPVADSQAEEIARKTFHEAAIQHSVKSYITEEIERPVEPKAKATKTKAEKAETASKPRTTRPRARAVTSAAAAPITAPIAAAAAAPASKPSKVNNPFIHDFEDVQGSLLTLDDEDDFIQQRAG
jgi:endonuclease YncB( thermonuclease family)